MKKSILNEQYIRFRKLANLITESEYERLLEDDATDQKVKDILGASYPEFVQKLGDNIKDPKFVAAIEKFSKENPVQTSDKNVPVTELQPTQNEIDVNKSLIYPLTNPKSASELLKGGDVAIARKKIVTAGGGKFIIDGHHRWSQAYVINPEISIAALDITNIDDGIDGLKATQMGIAASIKKVPTASVKGSNLLKMGENELKAYVKDTITKEVMKEFVKAGKVKVNSNKDADNLSDKNLNQVANFIWENVKQMQGGNQPVSGAPKRDIMPQTDDAPNWDAKAPALESYKKIDGLLAELVKKSTIKNKK
jgi:hypothetical protein